MKYEQIDAALQREIKIVENDTSLSPDERRKQIAELEREAREYLNDL
jgi:hypothetical protein